MLLPIKFLPAGGWKFTGYEGLASHGGTLGLIIALWLYCRKTKLHYMDVLDMIAVATPITACCIRLANLMNSEIIGKPSDVPWAFIFERVDMQPRHPGQLYAAIAYLILFFIMIYLHICLPFLHRIFEGEPRGFREQHDVQHGTMAKYSIRYSRHLLHVFLRPEEKSSLNLIYKNRLHTRKAFPPIT